jgi:Tol biopolymer transport system component
MVQGPGRRKRNNSATTDVQSNSKPLWSKQTYFATIGTTPNSSIYSVGRSMPLKLGDILNKRYRIENVLGQGGMGAVYRALDVNLGVPIALKENLFITEEYARQFKREANILASLRHPHLPRVTDHFVFEGEGQYLVMDFVEGEDLRERLERDDLIPEEEALPWFLEICDALAYLHTRTPPILHRDIKPGNIKITPEGKAILVDFGLAKVADDDGSTTTGAKAMTPGFSPPEQYGTGPTDARTDVYSLAATLYVALTGAIPEDALERAMGRETLTPLRKWNSKISSGIARAVERALSIPPDDRYQSIGEFAAALTAAPTASNTTVSRVLPYLEPNSQVIRSPNDATLRAKIDYLSPQVQRWPVVGFLAVLAIVIVAGVFITIPEMREQLSAILAPPAITLPTDTAAPTEEAAGTPTESVTVVEPGATEPIILGPTEEPTDSPTVEPTIEPTPASTPVGGGVGQIAFASIQEGVSQIYLMNVDGTGLTQLTDLKDGACQPTWSPDGSQLLMISPCRLNQESYPGSSIWVLSIEDLEPEQLPTTPGGGDFDPAWSPNGDQFAFTSTRDGIRQVYLMDFDDQELFRVSSGSVWEYQPEWDPRGTNLLITTSQAQSTEVYLIPIEGGDRQRFSMAESQGDSHASWSADGQYVLFERSIGQIPRLFVKAFEDRLRPADQVCFEGTRASQPMAEPSWSPDGQWIAFETWTGDGVDHNIAIMTANCTNYFEFTVTPEIDFDPVWRPER